ncbi:hypothetical protein KC19_5G112700 [Ceratodon purpureus]|uniref:Uncharacterized protein n=1 Tax=Ceratodon purpureus TaxID=3225 RepID=A0A8T0I1F3_CERPU|nr:hypothetical protein KC19_5G112700 [Ceratodon purpureus]
MFSVSTDSELAQKLKQVLQFKQNETSFSHITSTHGITPQHQPKDEPPFKTSPNANISKTCSLSTNNSNHTNRTSAQRPQSSTTSRTEQFNSQKTLTLLELQSVSRNNIKTQSPTKPSETLILKN